MEINREIITLEYDEILDFWDSIYFENSQGEINGVTFTRMDKINTSEFSDGESFEYIVQRQTDGKYFKFSWWEGGSDGYVFSNGKNSLTEVFPEIITTTKWV